MNITTTNKIVNILVEECKIDKYFAEKLMEHYINRNQYITNNNATIRIFGLLEDSNKHKNNRLEIDRELERMISENLYGDCIKQVTLKSTGQRKKKFKGYEFSYDVYKMLCLKFNKDMYKYYIKLESVMFKQIEILEKENSVMKSLISSFEHKVKEQNARIFRIESIMYENECCCG